MVSGSGAWSELRLVERVRVGNRNEVWAGELGGERVAVRRSRRSPVSLAWELDVLARAHGAGVGVALPVASDDGRPSVGGVVVQPWIEGRVPTSGDDWHAVAAALQRVHTVQGDQRPGACVVTELGDRRRSIDADLDRVPTDVGRLIVEVFRRCADAPVSLIHGDPEPSNIRIDADDRVWLLDWDESRVDMTWHDLSNLGIRVLDDADHDRAALLSHAWEAVNAWVVEPRYARTRLAELERLLGAAATD